MGQDPYIHQQIYIYFFIIRTYINELQLSAWFYYTLRGVIGKYGWNGC